MLNPFKRTYNDSELKVFDFLSQVLFFERLRNSELEKFLPAIHYRKYLKDEAVFFSNDPSQAIYIVRSGTINLAIDIKENFETVLLIGEEECFGENALLENTKRVYTAIVSSEEADLMVIPSYAIQEIFDMNPLIKAKMLASLAGYYNNNNHRLFKSYQSSFGFFTLGQMFK
jgi:CRP/FNR family cyclic AMP-dependent transcriptional regulator